MFSSPSFRTFNVQENRDVLVARKPGVSNSARKPLGDRSVNELKSVKPEPIKPKISNKLNSSAKKATPKPDYPEWLMDTCSFKDVEDTYEDIWPKSEHLNTFNFKNFLQPKTPPPKITLDIDPMFLMLPEENVFKINKENVLLEKLPVEDVDFPDFDISF